MREIAHMAPADFAEVRRMVESMRPSLYLDGPSGVDWIFRNRLLANREEGLYVDYVHDDEGNRWLTPATSDEISFGGPSPAIRELVGSLERLGAMTEPGLAITAEAWAQVKITDNTHWQEVVQVNHEVAAKLIGEGLGKDATDADVKRVTGGWTFPLSDLDLSMIEVSRADLEAEQERLAATY